MLLGVAAHRILLVLSTRGPRSPFRVVADPVGARPSIISLVLLLREKLEMELRILCKDTGTQFAAASPFSSS